MSFRDQRFPLSSRGGFEEDLDYLAQVVAAKLEFPTQEYTRDRLLEPELDRMLEFGCIHRHRPLRRVVRICISTTKAFSPTGPMA